jgi:hypothetical protein
MALKFEIIGNNLVVTETTDGSVKLERPAADIYGICEDAKWKIFTRSQRNDVLLEASNYNNLQNSAGAALNKASLTTFFRSSLGFSKAGSAALTTSVAASRDLTQADNGLTLDCAPGVVLTIPPGLVNFGIAVRPAGVKIACGAGVTTNGSGLTVTTTSQVGAINPTATANSYDVVGA